MGIKSEISRLSTSQSELEIRRRDGFPKYGPIGSGSFSVSAATTNTNLVQGNASAVGGMNLYMKKITVTSDKKGEFRVDIINGAGLGGGTVGNMEKPVIVGESGMAEVDINELIPWGANIYLRIVKFTDPTGTATGKFYHDSIETFHNTNVYTPKVAMFIGDSKVKGIGSSYITTNPHLSYAAKLVKRLNDSGRITKGINKGIPGAIMADIVAAKNCGHYDVDQIDWGFFCVGTNISASLSDYTSGLNIMLDYFLTRYPKTKWIISAPNRRLDIKELTVATYRPVIEQAVQDRNTPNMVYVNQDTLANWSDSQYGMVPGDYNTGVGGNVHENDLGHNVLYNSYWDKMVESDFL